MSRANSGQKENNFFVHAEMKCQGHSASKKNRACRNEVSRPTDRQKKTGNQNCHAKLSKTNSIFLKLMESIAQTKLNLFAANRGAVTRLKNVKKNPGPAPDPGLRDPRRSHRDVWRIFFTIVAPAQLILHFCFGFL